MRSLAVVTVVVWVTSVLTIIGALVQLLRPRWCPRIPRPVRVYKTHFITYGTVGFEAANRRILSEASEVFDTVRAYHPEDLEKLVEKHPGTQEVLQYKRGGGYWVWKPIVIWDALQRCSDGDILVYADTGCEICNCRVDDITDTFDAVRALPTGLAVAGVTSGGPRGRLHRMDVVHGILGNGISDFLRTPTGKSQRMAEAGRIVIHKGAAALGPLAEWRRLALHNPRWFTDDASVLPNRPEFVDHRHDQSIFDCIMFKHRVATSKCLSDTIGRWIQATRRRKS
jgi:hypothetical protein